MRHEPGAVVSVAHRDAVHRTAGDLGSDCGKIVEGERFAGSQGWCDAIQASLVGKNTRGRLGRISMRCPGDRPVLGRDDAAAAAIALRACLPQTTALSAAERQLLGEWLERIAGDGGAGG